MFENLVIVGLLNEKLNNGHPYELFFRDSNRNAVDGIGDRGTSTQLCEVTLVKTVGKKHYQALPKLSSDFPKRRM